MTDWYIDNVINSGDEVSKSLAEMTAKTIHNQPELVKVLQQGKNNR